MKGVPLSEHLRGKQGPQQWGMGGAPARGPALTSGSLPPQIQKIIVSTPSQSPSAQGAVQDQWVMEAATRLSSHPPPGPRYWARGYGVGAQEDGNPEGGEFGTHPFPGSLLGCSLKDQAQNPRGKWVGGKQVPGHTLLDASSTLDLLCFPVSCFTPCALSSNQMRGSGMRPQTKCYFCPICIPI